jgi:hypothetical protein
LIVRSPMPSAEDISLVSRQLGRTIQCLERLAVSEVVGVEGTPKEMALALFVSFPGRNRRT